MLDVLNSAPRQQKRSHLGLVQFMHLPSFNDCSANNNYFKWNNLDGTSVCNEISRIYESCFLEEKFVSGAFWQSWERVRV